MKKFNLLFFLILATNIVAQEQPWYPGEMYLATANVNPPSQELIFSIEAQSTVWAGSNSPRSYWILGMIDTDIIACINHPQMDIILIYG